MNESFNAWVNKMRSLPIVLLLSAYRQKCMVRLHSRYASGCAWEGKVTPNARETLKDLTVASRKCSIFLGRNNEFEVKEGKIKFAVKLNEGKCSCKWWDISGLPCKHAIRAILYNRSDPEDFCHPYCSVEKYVQTYNGIIHPMLECDLDPQDDSQVIHPNEPKKKPRRPKKKRRLEEGE